jgi:hypothetical protein
MVADDIADVLAWRLNAPNDGKREIKDIFLSQDAAT